MSCIRMQEGQLRLVTAIAVQAATAGRQPPRLCRERRAGSWGMLLLATRLCCKMSVSTVLLLHCGSP